MRIIGGRFRGRPVEAPAQTGPGVQPRPTTDRVRESLFNILEHGDYPPLEGARVLDLFAGTGALGLEALSRGASRVCFIDDGAPARALLRRNIERLGVIGQTKIYRRDATSIGPNRGAAFSHVFLDPPYGSGLATAALASARAGGWLAPGSVAVVETGSGEAMATPDGFEPGETRRYGETRLSLFHFQD